MLFLAGAKSDKKFYDLLKESADNITRASQAFAQLAANMSDCHRLAAELKEMENQGDSNTHEILNLLNQVFMTPLDREDIHSLAVHLDDVMDGIEKVASRISLYGLTKHDPIIADFASILHQQAQSLQAGIDKLCAKRFQDIKNDVVHVNELENRADQLLREGLRNIFAAPEDYVRLIQLKEVYELLEDTTDQAEDVANIMESVVMRNA